MKRVKILFLALAIGFSSAALATNGDEPKKVHPDSVTQEIQQLLKDPGMVIEEDLTANVLFTLNKDGEVVVLSVDSDNDMVEDFVKQRLNYKKLNSQLPVNIKEFKLPVRIQP